MNTVCSHGNVATAVHSAHTGALLGWDVEDESHADMTGSYFCPAN